jgi:hypothetical protein
MIAHARKTVVINRPVESVFDFVLNGGNNRLWKSSVLEVQPLGDAPYGVGSKFQQEVSGPEGPTAGDYQITACKPNELLGIQVMNGPARWMAEYRFRSLGKASEVMCEVQAEREGLTGITDAAFQRSLEQEAQSLVELKAFLEKIA